jgi:VIT1/CCC1 family predicted Fe2+/Mn2+ transporter
METTPPPLPAHREGHFGASETVRDIVIGMSDGLTVPFALAAGLTSAVHTASLSNPNFIVVTAGLAEIAAGSIAMGLGGYLAARSESEHYASERRREEMEVVEKTEVEVAETVEILENYGLTREQSLTIVDSFKKRPKAWVDFMMRFELGLEEPDPRRALSSARNIALSYIAGGLIPLVPYMIEHDPISGLKLSVMVTLIALLIFGYVKGKFTGTIAWRSGLQTLLIGGLAAGAAFLIAKAVG